MNAAEKSRKRGWTVLKIKFAVINQSGQGGPLWKGRLSKDSKAMREQAMQQSRKSFPDKTSSKCKGPAFQQSATWLWQSK